METNYYLLGGLILGLIVLAIIGSYFRNKYYNKVVPYTLGNGTIYLKRSEIPHFESMGRNEQRKYIRRFEAQVKAGKYLPVYKRGKVIGYIKNAKWKEAKKNRR